MNSAKFAQTVPIFSVFRGAGRTGVDSLKFKMDLIHVNPGQETCFTNGISLLKCVP